MYPINPDINVRNLNKYAILDFIRFTPGGIARAELARQLGLSRSAITAIITELIERQIVIESDRKTTPGGRRPIMIEINGDKGLVVGVDMGATHLRVILADLSVKVLKEMEEPFDILIGPTKGLQQVDALVRQLVESAGEDFSRVLAVGLGVPGPVIVEEGIVSAPPIMPGWSDFPIVKFLQERWGCPISLNNDAELGALGEWAYGAGRGHEHLAFIKVGSGVGAGLIIHGQIYRGTRGTAGEIGHTTILPDGPVCSCGSRGCLEAVSGGQAIARKAMEAVRANQRTELALRSSDQPISAQEVAEAARRGDLVAQQIVADSGRYLGIAIASLINLFNPSVVVVGGGIAQMGDMLLEPIRKAANERVLRSAMEHVRITSAMLGNRSASIGAVVQAVTMGLFSLINEGTQSSEDE